MARSVVRLLVALTLVVGSAALALPANAEAFRYWGYYSWQDAAWTFAETGPAEAIPPDGAVEGWRFATTGEDSSRVPRADGDFEQLCSSTPAADGTKRVGVVIDYGTTEDAPDGDTVLAARGACAAVPEDASGSDVLAAVADLRLGEGGFVCGIDGYPAAGCGDSVEGEAPSGDEAAVELELAAGADAGEGTRWTGLLIGVAAVAVVATAGIAIARRRSPDDSSGAADA
jgi:hypothetical protein